MARGQRGPTQNPDDQNHERVARRAYERWEARGREDGRDQEDWFEAEREIEQGASEQTTGERSQRRGSINDAA